VQFLVGQKRETSIATNLLANQSPGSHKFGFRAKHNYACLAQRLHNGTGQGDFQSCCIGSVAQ
jgi:hypothetical protein